LIAGAIALAVIAPSVEITDSSAEAGPPPPNRTEVLAQSPEFAPLLTLGRDSARVSRSGVRAPSAPHRPGIRTTVRHVAQREKIKIAAVRPEARVTEKARTRSRVETRHAALTKHRVTTKHRTIAKRAVHARKRVTTRRASSGMRAMSMVVAYARAQVGKRYVRGGDGPNSFDCSGFTKRAYARAGVRLPHSSGAQADRARSISRSQARAGDLVVGPGHVGIYMGNGMMIDAGNPGTGVVYRRLYAGLHIERL
jgi:peptidoglycan DL-endopeptidase CwlO